MSSIISSGSRTKKYIKSFFCGAKVVPGILKRNKAQSWSSMKHLEEQAEEKIIKSLEDSNLTCKQFEDLFFKVAERRSEVNYEG
jgi:hypothetical protein